MFIHTLFVHFYTNSGLFCMCKKQQKTCVSSQVSPLFLVKRKNAQVPFVSLGKNISFRQAIFLVSRQDAPTELRTFDPYDILGVRLDVYGGKGWLPSVPQCYASWMHGTRKGTKQNLRDHC